jgi:bla regulator protein blaR1
MIAWAVETLIASTFLMLVVLVVRTPVARIFGPHVAYGLWLLPALRLLLPPLPEAVTPAPMHMLPVSIDIEALLAAPIDTNIAQTPSYDWLLLGSVFWGLGALLFLAWHIHSYRRFVSSALDQATQLPRFDRDGVEVCASPVARGPFAAGIFLKTIVLPEDYRRRYAKDELRLAIEHEVQHHHRCDMSANFAALTVLALHWWNPIAYIAHRAFRVDQELACDAVVLARATPEERHAYGSALLKSACGRLPVAACALGAGDDLKRRLKMMRVYSPNPARARLGSFIATGLVGGGLMLTASNGIAAETTKKVEERVRTVLAPVVAPLPPLPPAPPVAPAAAPRPPKPPHPVIWVEKRVKPDGRVTTIISHDDENVDTAEINREVMEAAHEAAAEAAEAAREASRQAAEQVRIAMVQVHAQMPRIRAETMRAAAHSRATAFSCKGVRGDVELVDDHGNKTSWRCGGSYGPDRAELRREIIAALTEAKREIARDLGKDLTAEARNRALASIDRKLAELRAAK